MAKYIGKQQEHHRKWSFAEELKMLVERYGLKWHQDETVETVSAEVLPICTPLEAAGSGVLMRAFFV